MPALKSASTPLKVCALGAAADVAKAVRLAGSDKGMPGLEDLVKEAVDCLSQESWTLSERTACLAALLEMLQCPPHISQMARCSMLHACFSAALPAATAAFASQGLCYTVQAKSEGDLKGIQEGLVALLEEVRELLLLLVVFLLDTS
jgi:hypothetical protein